MSDGGEILAEPDLYGVRSQTGVDRPLVMKFGGSLVEQLGAQLYPSVTATVAELISNAWDADAANVWISIPFESNWDDPLAEIVVLDDGHGMTREQAQETYLIVGRKKRLGPNGDRSERGRPVHGRKGIGKLAAFGTAGYLECTTVRHGETTAFGIDYDELRRLRPDRDYFVDVIKNPPPLISPEGLALAQGTRVRLTGLRVKRKISEQSFLVSMSRRFALNGMNVLINGKPLRRFDIPLEYKLPRDLSPRGVLEDDRGWAVEELPSGNEVRWWIGFTAKPLVDSEQQGISVLARDKMAQRPFKFERAQGTTAQLGYEYLVGEVQADWLDQGVDIDTDLIQSNRDQLQLEDPRLDEFVAWGRTRLAWALRARQELRVRDQAERNQNDEILSAILSQTTGQERRALEGVVKQISRLPAVEPDEVHELLQAVVDSREESRLRGLVRGIGGATGPNDPELWSLVDRAGEIDARRLVGVLDARLETLAQVMKAVDQSADLLVVARNLQANIWLLNPQWNLYADPVTVSNSADPNDETAGLIALRPMAPAPADEIVLVQVVVGRSAGQDDVARFKKRMRIVATRYPDSSVEGLLVAPDFDNDDARDTSLEIRAARARARTLTWRAAIQESIAKHEAWRSVSQRRAGLDEL
jgi:hypothetical protein